MTMTSPTMSTMTAYGKILIVEDDDDLRRGLALRIKASGFDVVLAADGLSAVSTARTERPDLVLLDIGLPGGTGLSVLERYSNCAALIFTPVIVLTGRDPLTIESEVRKYGVAGFLTKPADNDELLAAIGRALGGQPDPAASNATFGTFSRIDSTDWPWRADSSSNVLPLRYPRAGEPTR
jgi:DNA-binding response OmpR family regulator